MTTSTPRVCRKRIYQAAEPSDGTRILVDRLWPRGISKSTVRIDKWVGEIAPTTRLRKWFDHEPLRFDEFRRRYWRELDANSDVVGQLVSEAGDDPITLLYAARDTDCNHAVVLRDFILNRLPSQDIRRS